MRIDPVRDARVWEFYRQGMTREAICKRVGLLSVRSVRRALAREAVRRGVEVPRRRPAEHTAPRRERDAEMLAEYKEGRSGVAALARRHRVTEQAVRIVLHREAARQGVVLEMGR